MEENRTIGPAFLLAVALLVVFWFLDALFGPSVREGVLMCDYFDSQKICELPEFLANLVFTIPFTLVLAPFIFWSWWLFQNPLLTLFVFVGLWVISYGILHRRQKKA